MSDQIIARVSQSLAKEQSLESLVRQLLEMLEMVTDMESTYLTKVDVEARLQHIMFARNSQKMHIPENFTVLWDYSKSGFLRALHPCSCKRLRMRRRRNTQQTITLWLFNRETPEANPLSHNLWSFIAA